jgi:hypothetical protein
VAVAGGAALGWVAALRLRRAKLKLFQFKLCELLLLLRARRIEYSGRAKLQPINRKRGVIIAAGGVILLLTSILPHYLYPFNTFAKFPILLGIALLIRSRGYFQASADVLLKADRRRPVLFLRSFADDEKMEYQAGWLQLPSRLAAITRLFPRDQIFELFQTFRTIHRGRITEGYRPTDRSGASQTIG